MSKFNPLDYTPRKDVFDEALFDTIIDEFSPKKIDKKRPVFEFDPNSPTEIITGSLLKIGQREVADWGSKFERFVDGDGIRFIICLAANCPPVSQKLDTCHLGFRQRKKRGQLSLRLWQVGHEKMPLLLMMKILHQFPTIPTLLQFIRNGY